MPAARPPLSAKDLRQANTGNVLLSAMGNPRSRSRYIYWDKVKMQSLPGSSPSFYLHFAGQFIKYPISGVVNGSVSCKVEVGAKASP